MMLHWSDDQFSDAAAALLSEVANRPPSTVRVDDVTSWLSGRALEAGFIAETVEFTEADLRKLSASCPPTILRTNSGEIYVIVRRERGGLVLRTASGGLVTENANTFMERIVQGSSAGALTLASAIKTAVPTLRNLKNLERALSEELTRGLVLARGTTFRKNYGETTKATLGSLDLPKHAGRLLGTSLLQSVLSTGSWALIGALALYGHAELSSLVGWGLLSMTALALQVATTQYVGRFTVRAATRLRLRLLEGALALESDELSEFGLGGLMVISTQADQFLSAVISLFLSILGTLTSIISTVAVLSAAPMPAWTLTTFAVFLLAPIALLPKAMAQSTTQQSERVRLTTEMVERMLGHRTRLIQQTPKSWHEGEDESLETYAHNLDGADRLLIAMRTLPRVYFLIALSALFFVLVVSPTQEALALVLGGITLGYATIGSMVEVVLSGSELLSQWRSLAPVIREAATKRAVPLLTTKAASHAEELLELRAASFAYAGRRPVFDNVNLLISKGDRVLIEGPSGGGKTTMAALLAGLRKPNSGLVFVKGVDHHSIGEHDLRRTIASAPQFYKNHIFSGPFAFNLLLGRRWPPSNADLREASEVCKELGLGALLEKMPAGLYQFVGETGWQLSHGEKSRVYLARTILQGSDLVLLDETFGALDPATLNQCMETTLSRCSTVVVITHR
jgi:ATP-binding cassette, subfamily B, bacterial